MSQLARLLQEPGRHLTEREVYELIDRRFAVLVDGLLAEAAASDDVFDRRSGLEYLQARLAFLAGAIDKGQLARLAQALQEKMETW